MARVKDRQLVFKLRKQGKTYSEIKKLTGISKSTLSDWLKDYPLSQQQLTLLQKNKIKKREVAIEKTRIVKIKKREQRLTNTYETEKKYWTNLTDRELEIAGLFLYWGEGSKKINGSISLNNTDPKVMKFTLYWLKNVLKIPENKIKVYLHLYNDMNIDESIQLWSNELHLPVSQFMKPYVKQTTKDKIDQKGFGFGTCTLVVNNVLLKEKIIMAINAIADYYSSRI